MAERLSQGLAEAASDLTSTTRRAAGRLPQPPASGWTQPRAFRTVRPAPIPILELQSRQCSLEQNRPYA